jgi:hypothetical protein
MVVGGLDSGRNLFQAPNISSFSYGVGLGEGVYGSSGTNPGTRVNVEGGGRVESDGSGTRDDESTGSILSEVDGVAVGRTSDCWVGEGGIVVVDGVGSGESEGLVDS